jgi:hypothetical protein
MLHWSWISILPKFSVPFSFLCIWQNHITFGLVNTAIWVIPVVCKVWREDILGTYAEVFKATISFIMSIHLHGQLSSHWENFHEILYWGLLQKFAQKNQVWLKESKNIMQFTWRHEHIFYNNSEVSFTKRLAASFYLQNASLYICLLGRSRIFMPHFLTPF